MARYLHPSLWNFLPVLVTKIVSRAVGALCAAGAALLTAVPADAAGGAWGLIGDAFLSKLMVSPSDVATIVPL